ncbi:MAG: hypothetical protein IKA36_01215 [Clostridia bacterium]|nr:hypothetical protein [Clostridia bacterium]
MKNSQIVKEIIETLEKEHLNLYHDITKEKLTAYVKSISWDKLNDMEFDREMLKLFHQFKDAHTNYYLSKEKNLQRYENKFEYINRVSYVIIDGKYHEVLEINGKPMKGIVKSMTELLTYETDAWKNSRLNVRLNFAYYYKMLGITKDDKLNLKVKRGNKVFEYQTKEMNIEKLINSYDKPKNYSFDIVDDNVIHIKYNVCQEMKNYPFDQFVKDVKKACKENKIEKYIMDLRGNTGGDSSIIKPLVDLIEKMELKGVVLIDNGVFSSGRFAVADFKKRFNTPLIGQSTGGAAASYGYNKNLMVENKSFSCSIRYWDFSDVFGYTGEIKPDIFVTNRVIDREKEFDNQLDTALDILYPKKSIKLDLSKDFQFKL